ncbi:MAG TPA: non-homologous end-joining DNA ligase [Solirubrobacteraceae bacterium]|nr:non-homologous end-joining DNA ligase [Solirubrobacteraceae bacterium]
MPAAELGTPAPPPNGANAMKATLTTERFSDPAWIYERKLDGIRCIAVRDGGEVRLRSRNEKSLNGRYPELAEALNDEPCDRFAVDGEVVAFDGSQTSFAKLAQRGQRYVPVFYYVFDILWLDGCDVRALPLKIRKRLLKQALSFKGHVRFTPHRNEHGEEFFKRACRKGWEGLIAKRADSTYGDGRSRDWLKFKCEHGQELVIGGYTAPQGSRTHFGALLLGYYEAGGLRYAGKVGTGFDEQLLASLGAELRKRETSEPPFADAATIKERRVTWVEPQLVAQVGFSEWTAAGRLRHPRFLGLRDDKAATEVVRER